MELFASTCTLSRWDSELQARGRNGDSRPLNFTAPEYFLRKSIRHARELLAKLNDNDDETRQTRAALQDKMKKTFSRNMISRDVFFRESSSEAAIRAVSDASRPQIVERTRTRNVTAAASHAISKARDHEAPAATAAAGFAG